MKTNLTFNRVKVHVSLESWSLNSIQCLENEPLSFHCCLITRITALTNNDYGVGIKIVERIPKVLACAYVTLELKRNRAYGDESSIRTFEKIAAALLLRVPFSTVDLTAIVTQKYEHSDFEIRQLTSLLTIDSNKQ